MKKSVLILLAFFMTAAITAQTLPENVFGIRGGLNFSNLSVDEDEMGIEPEGITSFHLGVSWQRLIIPDKPFYLETGLYLTQKGCKASGSLVYAKYSIDIKPWYLQVPVLAMYSFELPGGFTVQPYAGPYLGYGIGGKGKFSSGQYSSEAYLFKKSNIKDSDGDEQETPQLLKRFDMGIRLGVGATYGRFYLGLGYDWGLTDNVKEDEYGVGFARNRSFTLSVGYNFKTL